MNLGSRHIRNASICSMSAEELGSFSPAMNSATLFDELKECFVKRRLGLIARRIPGFNVDVSGERRSATGREQPCFERKLLGTKIALCRRVHRVSRERTIFGREAGFQLWLFRALDP